MQEHCIARWFSDFWFRYLYGDVAVVFILVWWRQGTIVLLSGFQVEKVYFTALT
jgi:hypothetical protein